MRRGEQREGGAGRLLFDPSMRRTCCGVPLIPHLWTHFRPKSQNRPFPLLDFPLTHLMFQSFYQRSRSGDLSSHVDIPAYDEKMSKRRSLKLSECKTYVPKRKMKGLLLHIAYVALLSAFTRPIAYSAESPAAADALDPEPGRVYTLRNSRAELKSETEVQKLHQ